MHGRGMGRDHKPAIGYIPAMATPTQHLETLNAAQRKAVTTGEALPEKGFSSPPLLIIAGAGTGKTNTLAHRVAHLVLNGVDPARILLLTFSRRAASRDASPRPRDRAHRRWTDTLGGKAQALAQRLTWAGTFHSVGNRLLRHYAPHLGLDPAFTVIDRGDAADLMDALRQELGLAAKEQRFPRKDTCLAIYSYRVNTRSSLKETLEQQYPWCLQWEEDLTQAVSRLRGAQAEAGNPRLRRPAALLARDDGASRRSPGTSADTSITCWSMNTRTPTACRARSCRTSSPMVAGVTVVGDDAQAIYSFRAATVENILDFPQRFTPPAEVVRAGAELPLDPAGAGCGQCADGRCAAPAPQAPDRGARRRRACRDWSRSMTWPPRPNTSAARCCTRREARLDLQRQAVLFRSASHSDLLEVELTRRQHPVRQVRRPEISRGRARQGPAGGAALGRQSAQYAGGVPRAAAAAGHGSGQCPPLPR